MKRFGLIGRRLGHSWSQDYFTRKFAELGLEGYAYSLFELPSVEGLKEWALREKLSGFNVTVPYKLAVIPQLDALDEVAAEVGAVNCVTVEDGRLVGHNTDAPAFMQTLETLSPSHPHTFTHSHIHTFTQSFILGTGGAARAVAWALRQLDIQHTFVSRHPEQHENAIPYTQLTNAFTHSHTNAFKHSLLVNATPVGMYPDINRTPLDLSPFTSHLSPLIVYDLIYNPSPTLLLRQAAERGARVKDGLEMLHRQADLSWQLWGENK